MKLQFWLLGLLFHLASKADVVYSTPIQVGHSCQESFDIYFAHQDTALQTIIDDVTQVLYSKTLLGQAICTQIFKGSQELIATHLGVSEQAASVIHDSCMAFQSASPQRPRGHRFIDPAYSNDSLKIIQAPREAKSVLFPGSGRRSFAFVFTNSEKIPFSSWTDSFANRTVFVLPERLRSDTNALFDLLLVLRWHEDSVYFDSKLNLLSNRNGWPETMRRELSDFPVESLELIAASNPLISSALGALRAFQLENEMFDRLMADYPGILNHRPKGEIAEFMATLDDDVAFGLTESLAQMSVPYSLPLLALTPLYGKFRSPHLKQSIDRNQLSLASKYYFESGGFRNFSFIDLGRAYVSPTCPDAVRVFGAPLKIMKDVADLMQKSILPEDLQSLQTPRGRALLRHLKTPLVSGDNISFSFAPRPRIGSGGW